MSTETKPLRRTLHLLCSANGKFLKELVGGEPVWTVSPQEAAEAGMSWLSSSEAGERLRKFRQLHPTTPASLAELHMEADPATPQEWRPVTVRTWGQLTAEPVEVVL